MEDTSESKAFADRDDKFYYNRLKYYKDMCWSALAYINFDEYIKELNEERDILNKELNKALKDIEKRPEIKKHTTSEITYNNNLMLMSKRLKKVNVYKKNMVMNFTYLCWFLLYQSI